MLTVAEVLEERAATRPPADAADEPVSYPPVPVVVVRTRRWSHRAALSLGRRLPGVLLPGAVLVVVAKVMTAGLDRYPALNDDEGTYVAQAWALRTRGDIAHYTYWYDHPPVGWFQLAWLTAVFRPLLSLFGSDGGAVAEARLLMMLPALVSVALVYVLIRRLGAGRVFAAFGMAAFGLSPLSVSILRQVFLDNLALPWVLATFVLAATPRRNLWAFAAAGGCLAIAVLSKETMLIAAPAVLLAVWQHSDPRTRSFCLLAFGGTMAALLVGYPLFAMLKGELLPGPGHVSLLEAVQFQLVGRSSTGSVLDTSSASHRLAKEWLATDPWLLGAGALAAVPAMLIRSLRPVAVALILFVVMGARPGYLPQPYVAVLLPLSAVVAASSASSVWTYLRRHSTRPRVLWRVVLVLLAVAGLTTTIAVAGAWQAQHRVAATSDLNAPSRDASRWMSDNVDHRARVLVDDTLFVDLVDAGFDPDLGVVWFFKMDFATNLDPSVTEALPRGYREFDYVISTPVIRAALDANLGRLEEVRRALVSSEQVAAFGDGATLVEIRRIVGPGAGSGRLPRGTDA